MKAFFFAVYAFASVTSAMSFAMYSQEDCGKVYWAEAVVYAVFWPVPVANIAVKEVFGRSIGPFECGR